MAPSSSPRAARRLAEFAFDPRPTDRTTIDALYSVYDILQRGYQIAPSGIFMDSSKQFLIGLEPSPPPNHIWQEYAGYSIYSAEQDPSLWSQHSNDCTQISIASSPAYVRAEWQADAGRLGTKEMNGDMVSVVPPGVQHTIHWNRRAPLLHTYLNEKFFDSMENVPTRSPQS